MKIEHVIENNQVIHKLREQEVTMPLPKPKQGESEDDFISRCMSNKTMKEDYTDNDQRLAVCFSQWKKEKKDKENDSTSTYNFGDIKYKIKNVDVELVDQPSKEKKDNTDDDELERRYIDAEELRFDEEKNELTGYAARFNVWSEDLGFFKERIKKGAFKKTIEEGDIRALFNHDPNLILGRTTNGTLHLEEDNKGLLYTVKLPDVSYVRDLKVSIKRQDITGNSFGFKTIQDKWTFKPDKELDERDLIEVKLRDISPVTFPAYPQTNVQVRSILKTTGIDYDELGMIFRQANKGLEITDDDKVILKDTIRIIDELLKTEEPDAEVHSDTVEEPRVKTALTRLREKEWDLIVRNL